MTNEIRFSTLSPSGVESNMRTIQVRRCPFLIMVPDHYREDGSCKCDDPAHREMMIAEWEYTEDDFRDIPLRVVKRGSSFKLWNKRLDGDTITRGQIIQWNNAICPGSNGFWMGGAKTNLTHDDCVELVTKFDQRVEEMGGFKLEPSHTKFGIEWLKADRKRAESIGVTPEMIDTFREFRWIGSVLAYVNPYGIRAQYAPMYRVISDAGNVDYSWSPWQGKVYG